MKLEVPTTPKPFNPITAPCEAKFSVAALTKYKLEPLIFPERLNVFIVGSKVKAVLPVSIPKLLKATVYTSPTALTVPVGPIAPVGPTDPVGPATPVAPVLVNGPVKNKFPAPSLVRTVKAGP